ncbi:predicted protein [Sclerotinia sclerotiorum 1980 UF-70]|uniref:Uncharacterized protein n=1 Tax=Sclerotinia sclerotiorum (strain ATCC 18683 / 1980 / Ss-1) TaxID=665079 RepID=A7E4Z6_SCLS1|nr:predicted protein [Sclerotinia sclerotiorum 1980 UF-70]EDN90968.1 predicted protein [Sclerotinia sclerotiorum 1980 UF-70]
MGKNKCSLRIYPSSHVPRVVARTFQNIQRMFLLASSPTSDFVMPNEEVISYQTLRNESRYDSNVCHGPLRLRGHTSFVIIMSPFCYGGNFISYWLPCSGTPICTIPVVIDPTMLC